MNVPDEPLIEPSVTPSFGDSALNNVIDTVACPPLKLTGFPPPPMVPSWWEPAPQVVGTLEFAHSHPSAHLPS